MLKNIFKSTKTWRPQYHVSPGSPSPLYMGFCTRPVACSRYISLQTTLVILQTMAKSITITDYFFTSVSLIIKDNIKQNSHYTMKVQNQSLLVNVLSFNYLSWIWKNEGNNIDHLFILLLLYFTGSTFGGY